MIEQKIVADLDDIKAVTFECRVEKCRARLTVPITTTAEKTTIQTKLEIPKNCPSCHQEWISGAGASNQSEVPQIGFLTALEKVKELQATARFRIFLELEIPQTMAVLAVRAEK
jgi:hypothetical protein